jgi:hypothetical protein
MTCSSPTEFRANPCARVVLPSVLYDHHVSLQIKARALVGQYTQDLDVYVKLNLDPCVLYIYREI